jgi:fructokinase
MNDNNKYTIVGLGEVLWDMLPEGKKLGGAPANFAYHAAVLGNEGVIASRIGDDNLGREVLDSLRQLKIPDKYIQIDPDHPTGVVNVKLDENGQPDYTIIEDVAWDFMEFTFNWEQLAGEADAVCFGSLAQRTEESRQAIRQFLNSTGPETIRIYDINLRQLYYSSDIISESLKLAQIIKLNDEEMPVVIKLLSLECSDFESCAHQLIDKYNLDLVCLTRGANGSMLIKKEKSAEHPGFKVKVTDAVGAGDAYTAVLAHHYLRNTDLDKICESANRYGSWVATQSGATPKEDKGLLEDVLSGRK